MTMLRRTQSEEKDILVIVRMTHEQARTLDERARQFAGGNRSAWIRYAALRLIPPAREFVDDGSKKKALAGKS